MSVEEDGAAFIDEDYVNIVPQDLLERGIRLREEYGIYDIAWKFECNGGAKNHKRQRYDYPRRRRISLKRQ